MKKITYIKLINDEIATIIDTDNYKALKSEDYNFLFIKKSGFFMRWGKGDYTKEKSFSKSDIELFIIWTKIWKEKFNIYEFAADLKTDGSEINTLPEIADIEISSVLCSRVCNFCYKKNDSNGSNMTLDTFKKIFSKLPSSITQIAAGITDIDSNPDMWDIFEYIRSNGVIPNVTINCNKMTSNLYDRLSKTMGAVACSYYNEDQCFDSVKELTNRGMTQVNIHHMIHSGNFDETMELLKKSKTDKRLEKLNAIVLLSLKKVGLAKSRYDILPQDKFTELTLFALENNINIGYDSCGSTKFLISLKDNDKYKYMETFVDQCESTIYSMYINEKGYFSPCSFVDQKENGLHILECNDFLTDIWYNEKINKFRKKVIECRNCNVGCSVYNI